ncbi:MAG: hypothetical protein N838_23990 [Thiohalocapsa sp. PB-PSB1]|jgi:multidrug resistance efflux pump|nr:MAG: hypothetical protein N838_23865 [Thiohalocapsa sp. PB-PSB1]QQO51984.1 MAG: hypothetical protein N838_23990 [Thiohalocapsa sp. PB-PSB1]HCS88804.1 hypothetical protein [Chromatiaceae bacterium]
METAPQAEVCCGKVSQQGLRAGQQSGRQGRCGQAHLGPGQASYEVAQADLDKAQAQRLQAGAALLQAQAELGAPGEDNAQLRATKAALQTAKLNLGFTEVRASVDG